MNNIRKEFDAYMDNTYFRNCRMFSYKFRMLFRTSFIFVESCCAFLIKILINRRQIWDTLPAFNRKLFGK